MNTIPEFSRNKTLFVISIIFFVCAAVFFVEEVVFALLLDDLSKNFELINLITLASMCIIGVVALGIHTYYCWRLNSTQFYKWNEAQEILNYKWLQERRGRWQREGIKGFWMIRIMNTAGFLFCIFMSSVMLTAIKTTLFGF